MREAIKNILIALELNESDNVLLKQGIIHAKAHNSNIWIIHVAAPDPDFVGYDVGPQYIRDSRAETLKSEHKKLHEYIEAINGQKISCEGLLIQGPTVEMIKQEIEKLDIDLLIMGENKHGFLYDTFIGHTSSKILKDVPIPTLIVPLGQ